jgi:hypothetical protein
MSEKNEEIVESFNVDLVRKGQRKINLIWEITQAMIAVIVVICTMGAGTYVCVTGKIFEIPNILCVAFGTIVGFYFGRTNHVNVGGTGDKPHNPSYEGR